MKVWSNLDLIEGGIRNFTFAVQEDFPLNPKPGTAIFKEKRLMLCVTIGDDALPVWVPLTQEMTMYTYKQAAASSRWEVQHNLNFSTPIVQCYDENGGVIQPSEISLTDANNMVILFSEPVAGTAIFLVGVESGLPKQTIAFSAPFTDSAEWVVVHNLGYNPAVRIYQGSNEVQPKSIVHDNVNQLTVSFDQPESGTVVLY